ncbi:uncharacterized protein LOC122340968 [Puntigrus tetrazona]|uniref:uncharacterized protein LOC122340968 n=1 Tax=Puntigrus tetrazona TaxID=1606681 RepID=UPI001C88E9EE|nr:uncharacterized protein LOC122340968 [Puntigrus tetrazona]
MDSTEDDISARVLLRRVLHTELPRSPVTRSASNVRRSVRLKNTPGLESPGSALRHRLKKKLHESASSSPLPSPKRTRTSVANANPPAPAPAPASASASSSVYDEDMTTRGLLRGIIQMETEASLLMSGQPALQELELNPAESSAGEATEGLSGVELSDLTLNTEPLTHVVRGLTRKKWAQPDLEDPICEKRTQRAGLQRKVSNRRLQSVDAFDEAVQRCLEQGPNQGWKNSRRFFLAEVHSRPQ